MSSFLSAIFFSKKTSASDFNLSCVILAALIDFKPFAVFCMKMKLASIVIAFRKLAINAHLVITTCQLHTIILEEDHDSNFLHCLFGGLSIGEYWRQYKRAQKIMQRVEMYLQAEVKRERVLGIGTEMILNMHGCARKDVE